MEVSWNYDGSGVEINFTMEIRLKEVALTSHHRVLHAMVVYRFMFENYALMNQVLPRPVPTSVLINKASSPSSPSVSRTTNTPESHATDAANCMPLVHLDDTLYLGLCSVVSVA